MHMAYGLQAKANDSATWFIGVSIYLFFQRRDDIFGFSPGEDIFKQFIELLFSCGGAGLAAPPVISFVDGGGLVGPSENDDPWEDSEGSVHTECGLLDGFDGLELNSVIREVATVFLFGMEVEAEGIFHVFRESVFLGFVVVCFHVVN